MWFVYVLKSTNLSFIYIGFTNDLERRLREHNEGLTQSTKYSAPFILDAYVAVRTKRKVIELEEYFKTGSGKAVLKKRILSSSLTKRSWQELRWRVGLPNGACEGNW